MAVANALAYYDSETIMSLKSFTVQAQVTETLTTESHLNIIPLTESPMVRIRPFHIWVGIQ
jgi:hypothetical protein